MREWGDMGAQTDDDEEEEEDDQELDELSEEPGDGGDEMTSVVIC